jgi:hypothetical protein
VVVAGMAGADGRVTMHKGLLICVALGFSTACTYDNGDANQVLYSSSPNCGGVAESHIDTDVAIQVDPGVGAGAFIEYASGGHFHLTTSCDTTTNGSTCFWDILLTLDGASITNVVTESLEPGDSFASTDAANTTYHFLATTDVDLDGATFDTTSPGSALKFDALLDGNCAQRYMFWSGDGAIHNGPTSAVWLTPTTP